LAEMTTLLVEQFEIDRNKIKPEAHLFFDLDLDSIDTVDLIVAFQKITGKKIPPEHFKQVRTVQDAVAAIHKVLHS